MKKIIILSSLFLGLMSCQKDWPETAILGCMDSGACNYNENANMTDNDCDYISCAGCMDATAVNYDATATIDDGSCCFGTGGCTDPAAANYNINATCEDGSCIYPFLENFDNGIGVFNQVWSDNMDWTWQTGATNSTGTGPSDDVTGGGGYMYTEATGYENSIAMLNVDSINIGANQTLNFKYHMWDEEGQYWDNHMGSLEVMINGTSVWSISGDQGNQWNSAQVDLASFENSIISIKFIGNTGNGYRSDIAIDQIEIVVSK